MRKSYDAIVKEADEHGIAIIQFKGKNGRIQFLTKQNEIVSWMYKVSDGWRGYTNHPETTGIICGSKGHVANWCLDYAVNGF